MKSLFLTFGMTLTMASTVFANPGSSTSLTIETTGLVTETCATCLSSTRTQGSIQYDVKQLNDYLKMEESGSISGGEVMTVDMKGGSLNKKAIDLVKEKLEKEKKQNVTVVFNNAKEEENQVASYLKDMVSKDSSSSSSSHSTDWKFRIKPKLGSKKGIRIEFRKKF